MPNWIRVEYGENYRTREIKIKKKDTNYWTYYPNAEEAARDLGIDKSALSRVLRGERKSVNGYVAVYVVPDAAMNEQLMNALDTINKKDINISRHEYMKEKWTNLLEDDATDGTARRIKELINTEERKIAEAKAIQEENKAKIAEINKITGREALIEETQAQIRAKDISEQIEEQLAALEQVDNAAAIRITKELEALKADISDKLKSLIDEAEANGGLSVDQLLRQKKYLELRNQIDEKLRVAATDIESITKETLFKAAELVNPQLSIEQLTALINIDYNGITFSERIWNNVAELRDQLYKKIRDCVVLGDNWKDAARKLSERFSVAENRARCLIRTETARAYDNATIQNYKDNGITEVEIYVENNACPVCESYRGKVFTVKDRPNLPAH